MDRDAEAGAELLLFYEEQWKLLRSQTDVCLAHGKKAHAQVLANKDAARATTNRFDISKLLVVLINLSVHKLHVNLTQLPAVMETLDSATAVLGRVETGLKAVEAALLDYELMVIAQQADNQIVRVTTSCCVLTPPTEEKEQ